MFSFHTAVLENTKSTKLQFTSNSSLVDCQLAKSQAFGVLGFNFEGSRPNRVNCKGLEWNIINTKGENSGPSNPIRPGIFWTFKDPGVWGRGGIATHKLFPFFLNSWRE